MPWNKKLIISRRILRVLDRYYARLRVKILKKKLKKIKLIRKLINPPIIDHSTHRIG